MNEYPIAVAGIFTKRSERDPFCTVCFFATMPPHSSADEVETHICSIILPRLAQIVVCSDADDVSAIVDRYAYDIAVLFDVECEGYLNAAYINGSIQHIGEV